MLPLRGAASPACECAFCSEQPSARATVRTFSGPVRLVPTIDPSTSLYARLMYVLESKMTDSAVNPSHARRRLRQWLRAKHKVRGEGTSRFPDQYLHEGLGLIQLQVRTRDFPWANA